MNHGLKLLAVSFSIAAIAAICGCLYDNTTPNNKGWTGAIVHCEVHGHRPLDEAIRDEARDRERRDMSQEERDYHDSYDSAREQEQNTDFGSMT